MKTPEWYWDYDLHDSKILSATTESAWNPMHNRLVFKMDSEGALCEIDISEIRFYNFKILTNNFDLTDLNNAWWLSDEITQKGNYYLLELELINGKGKKIRLEIKFQKAEVIRNNSI